MAKTRAQRKAEQRRRQQQGEPGGGGSGAREPKTAEGAEPSEAKQAKAPKSKAAEPAAPVGKEPRRLVRRKAREQGGLLPPAAAIPGVTPEPIQLPPPPRAEVELPEEEIEQPDERKSGKELEKEQRRKERARELQKGKTAEATEPTERRRSGVAGFLASCVAELRRVQWPDRDALVQASAVTLLFVIVMAAYLGALDAVFNFMIKQIL